MQPKPHISDQGDLFRLADQIDWSFFEREFGPLYSVKRGRPGAKKLIK